MTKYLDYKRTSHTVLFLTSEIKEVKRNITLNIESPKNVVFLIQAIALK